MQSSVSFIASSFVRVYVGLNTFYCCLQSGVSFIASSFVCIYVRLNAFDRSLQSSISFVASSFVCIDVRLQSGITAIYISLCSQQASLRCNCTINSKIAAHGDLTINVQNTVDVQ